ncbi:MAG: hypothetical protein AABY88_02810 [Pseudomonadota bacterium]
MLTLSPPLIAAEALDDAAAYLRLSGDDELTLVAGLIGTALLQCEAFCGTILLRRAGTEDLRITGTWQTIKAVPLRSITAVSGLNAAGDILPIAANGYAIDIDEAGTGWLRIHDGGGAMRARLSLEAGRAERWGDIPAPLRQGMLRLVAHLHTNRDRAGDAGPPLAVAALWRSFRQIRLNGRCVA